MPNNKLTKSEISDALCDIRKAHRLLYEYQNRIINIIAYIKDIYGMPNFDGNTVACDSICPKNDPYAKLKIRKDMWAWDFFYSYMFEFYLGIDSRENGKEICLSIIEVSDTGYYESKEENKTHTNISTFKSPEESSSCLVFVFESKKQDADYYWKDTDVLRNSLSEFLESGNDFFEKNTQENHYFLLAKYDISRFLNKESTDTVLSEFNDKVYNYTSIRLIKRELN